MPGRFQPIDKLINLYDGYRKRLKIDQLDVILLQEQGQCFVIETRCPHRQHSLLDAPISDGMIVCALHQYGFDLLSGANREGLCNDLSRHEPVYEGNEIGVMIHDND